MHKIWHIKYVTAFRARFFTCFSFFFTLFSGKKYLTLDSKIFVLNYTSFVVCTRYIEAVWELFLTSFCFFIIFSHILVLYHINKYIVFDTYLICAYPVFDTKTGTGVAKKPPPHHQKTKNAHTHTYLSERDDTCDKCERERDR